MGLYLSYPYSCKVLIKFEFSQRILEKYSNMKFREIPSNMAEFFMRTDGQKDRHTDIKTNTIKLIVDFLSFMNASKNRQKYVLH